MNALLIQLAIYILSSAAQEEVNPIAVKYEVFVKNDFSADRGDKGSSFFFGGSNKKKGYDFIIDIPDTLTTINNPGRQFDLASFCFH